MENKGGGPVQEWGLATSCPARPAPRALATATSCSRLFSNSLRSIITELTDRSSHPHASGDYDPWSRPDPRRDFILSLGFAAQRGNSKMLRDANTRRLANRAGGRYATGARA